VHSTAGPAFALANCSNCHTPAGWTARFDHSTTGFPLTGAHATVACNKCHTSPATPATDCYSCHATQWQSTTTPAALAAGVPNHITAGFVPASCASCHGGIDHKAGSPWLEGMPAAYTRAQLQAFANGTRHNDISEQMRNVARNMTPGEIDAAAAYYAGAQP